MFKPLPEIIDDYELLLFDLWGVVIENHLVYNEMVDFINSITPRKPILFVSNVPRPAFVMKERLTNWGLANIAEDMVITSGDIARELILAQQHLRKATKPLIYHFGRELNSEILQNFDCDLTEDYEKAHVFLMTLHRNNDKDLTEFDELLAKVASNSDLLKICANPDIMVPEGEFIRYCAGFFARKIEQYGGIVAYTGKPKNEIYNKAFKKFPNTPKDKILMIGDSLETDILGAQNSGIHSTLLLTGNCRKIHHMHESIEDKINAIRQKCLTEKIIPNFISSL